MGRCVSAPPARSASTRGVGIVRASPRPQASYARPRSMGCACGGTSHPRCRCRRPSPRRTPEERAGARGANLPPEDRDTGRSHHPTADYSNPLPGELAEASMLEAQRLDIDPLTVDRRRVRGPAPDPGRLTPHLRERPSPCGVHVLGELSRTQVDTDSIASARFVVRVESRSIDIVSPTPALGLPEGGSRA
jgi:hypothetical protein